MGAVVSLDGFIADDNDDVGPLFDWYGNGDVTWSFPGADDESQSTQDQRRIVNGRVWDTLGYLRAPPERASRPPSASA